VSSTSKMPSMRWRAVTLTLLSLVTLYCLIAFTSIHYQFVRISPDFARVFFPPFFYYTKEFRDGSIGPIEIGDLEGLAEASLRRANPNSISDPLCRVYPRTHEISGFDENVCFTTPSSISRYPLLWLVGLDRGVVRYVKVTTLVPVDL
jgi:hypothetical protein